MVKKYTLNPLLKKNIQLDYDGYEDITKEPSGFLYPDDISISYNSTTRIVTVSASLGKLVCYYKGEIILGMDGTITTWDSPAHANTIDNNFFLHYNGAGLQFDTTPWQFDCVQIAFIQYYTGFKFALREPHGLMQWQSHKELHEVIGTYRQSGGDLSSYVLSSTTAANRRPGISACNIQDEDLLTLNAALTSKLYTQRYLSGAGAAKNFNIDQSDIIPLSGNHPYYNQFTLGAWQQTLMTNNNYGAIFVVAAPCSSDSDSQKYRYMFVQPQQQSATLATIQALSPSSLTHGDSSMILTEYVFIAKIIIQRIGGGTPNWQIISVESLTGSKFSQISSPSGAFLSSVAVDSQTITGDGTSLNPLQILRNIVGTNASPSDITASGISGITASFETIAFIQGSGGAVVVTGNPAINAGSFVGQKLTLIGKNATNTVTFNHGNGINLNGQWIADLDCVLDLIWNGSEWLEVSRSR